MHIQQTSRDALESIKPVALSMRDQVFAVIVAHPEGILAQDIETYLDNARSTVTARIRERVQDNRVCDSGDRGVTESGRTAIKWRAA
jgi:hypothetical protein